VAGTLSGRPEAVADDEREGEVGPARGSEEAGEHVVSEADIAVLDLLVELVFAPIEFLNVGLVEEQFERVEVLDECFQRALRNRVVDSLTGEVVAFHQRGNRERDLPVVGVGLSRLGEQGLAAGGQ